MINRDETLVSCITQKLESEKDHRQWIPSAILCGCVLHKHNTEKNLQMLKKTAMHNLKKKSRRCNFRKYFTKTHNGFKIAMQERAIVGGRFLDLA